MKSRLSDEAIITGILNGGQREEEALHCLYVENRDNIIAFIRTNKGRESEAQDVFQDAIIALYDNIKEGKFKGESSIRSYLYSIARFIWLNRLKRKKKEREILDKEPFVSIEESHLSTVLEGEKEKQVRALFANLGEQCSEILIRSIYYDYPIKEIAAYAGYENEQVARNKKYKCLKRLKKLIAQQPSIEKWLREVNF